VDSVIKTETMKVVFMVNGEEDYEVGDIGDMDTLKHEINNFISCTLDWTSFGDTRDKHTWLIDVFGTTDVDHIISSNGFEFNDTWVTFDRLNTFHVAWNRYFGDHVTWDYIITYAH
jgi:hypothetical protein